MQVWTIRSLLKWITDQLTDNQITSPKQNAEAIISHVLKMKLFDLYLNQDIEIIDKQLREISEFTKRRMKLEPLQYILGEVEFFGCMIKVNHNVLIPRPETEMLVEIIVKLERNTNQVLEIGTGSGAIVIALAKNINFNRFDALDISDTALTIAKQNAKLNNVEIHFFQSDLFENVTKKYDLIVSNPPYIPEKEFKRLPTEIKKYEPESALLAKNSGLYFYEEILRNAKEHLTESGKIYFEIGHDQASRISDIAEENGFKDIRVYQDLNKFDRIMRIQ